MIVLDSSAWLSFLAEEKCAAKVEKYISSLSQLIVPSMVLYEVYRQLIKKMEKHSSLVIVAQMQKAKVVTLTEEIALMASEVSLEYKLGTADAIVYATSLFHQAKLVTLDNDFRSLPGCVLL